ncbi:uncharacterized protein LOC123554131 isoform X4 [Mercenaria mercenaria]|uniref:uncharacterized protein LOC123554131 isoform X4 n=1 Tax=Mercenaria mercenaria TaxID=6596 RepID=UPI00234E881F|nr:uncharacterized protein LOC123554131 isoform X4 [Mercenaria mercenaria]
MDVNFIFKVRTDLQYLQKKMAKVIRDPAIGELYKIKELCAEKGVDADIQKRLSDAITLAEARDAYCASVSSEPSDALATLQRETLEYPFDQVYKDGKTKWKLNPRMMSGHFEGDAKETLLKLAEEKAQYDVVFIDANKDGYLNYFKTVIEKDLLAKGGTVVFDNALMYGGAYNMKSTNEHALDIRKCNEYVKSRDDMFQVLVPIRDGALIVRRKEDVFL